MCNHCHLRELQATSGQQTIAVIDDPFAIWRSGKRVYRHPPTITAAQFRKLSRLKHEKYFVVWFTELSDQCEC